MKITLHKLLTMSMLVCSVALLSTSCKTKEKFSDAEQNTMEQRADRNEKALAAAGVDNSTKTQLLKELKDLDEEMFNFLGTDPNDDAQVAMMKAMRDKRVEALKGKLTDDQIKAYMRALSNQAKQISKENKPKSTKGDENG